MCRARCEGSAVVGDAPGIPHLRSELAAVGDGDAPAAGPYPDLRGGRLGRAE